MLGIKLCAFFFVSAYVGVNGARILALYPCPSISHQVVFRPLTLELLKRGHQVTVLTPDPIFPKGSAPDNLTEIDVHDMSYASIKKYFPSIVTGSRSDITNQVKVISDLVSITMEEQMRTKEIQNIISNKTQSFDLILIESIYISALGITHILKAPTILVSSFGPFLRSYEIIGAPTHPILYPNMFRQRLYNLNLWEKINELYNQFIILYNTHRKEKEENDMIKKLFGLDTPPISILKDNVDMLFLNIHPIWEGNYPVPPNVIHMGGLHQKPPKNLPKDLQNYLDSSNNGVIYFSFGTNVQPSLLPSEKIAIFEQVFSQLPYNVIWKWDNDNLSGKSNNIKVFKWLPQADLLRHPNIKLFITQGGLQSTDEAITAGVPLIGIPMLGDQWYNVEKYVYHKIGVKLDFEFLTEDLLKDAIIEVVEHSSYRNNIAHLRTLMEDQPQAPLERAMWWIEYVLRHGGAKHMRAPTANISWFEYFQLDLIIIFISLLLFIVGSAIIITKYLVLHMLIKYIHREKLKKL